MLCIVQSLQEQLDKSKAENSRKMCDLKLEVQEKSIKLDIMEKIQAKIDHMLFPAETPCQGRKGQGFWGDLLKKGDDDGHEFIITSIRDICIYGGWMSVCRRHI
jgi:hypothetical protein